MKIQFIAVLLAAVSLSLQYASGQGPTTGIGPFAIYKLSSTDSFKLNECRDPGDFSNPTPEPGLPQPKPLNPVVGTLLTQEFIIVDVGSEIESPLSSLEDQWEIYDYAQIRIPFYTDYSVNGAPRKLYNLPSEPSAMPLSIQFVAATAANSFNALVKEGLSLDGPPLGGFEGGGQFATGVATPFKVNNSVTMNLIPRTLAGQWRYFSLGGDGAISLSFYSEVGAPKITFDSALTLTANNGQVAVLKSLGNPYELMDGETLTAGTLAYAVQLVINALDKLGYDQDPNIMPFAP